MQFAHLKDDAAVAAIRDRQLGHPAVWDDKLQVVPGRWYFFKPEFLRPATGKLRVALCARISRLLVPNATERLMQFAVCFHRTGALSQLFVIPAAHLPPPAPVEESPICKRKTNRFMRRARRSPAKHESIVQVEDGWMAPPALIDAQDDFCLDPSAPGYIAFLSGAPKGNYAVATILKTRWPIPRARFSPPSRFPGGIASQERPICSAHRQTPGHSGNLIIGMRANFTRYAPPMRIRNR